MGYDHFSGRLLGTGFTFPTAVGRRRFNTTFDSRPPLTYLIALVLVLLGLYAARRVLVRLGMKAIQRHPDYKAQMDLIERSYKAEETVVESADWFGKTGLPEDVERELPKYMRREAGELLLEDGSLKAEDLTYIGAFAEPDATVHYWSVPSSSGGEPTFAYVEVNGGNTCTGWGGREPPGSGSKAGVAV